MPAARKFQQAGHRQPKACGRAALAAGLFSVLQGCAALIPSSAENQPIALPAEWSAAAPSASVASTSLVQWWERFNDPLLTTLVADALKSNTGVLSAQAALRQARALRDVSAAGLWPTLNASATAQRNQSGNNDASNSYRVGLDAGMNALIRPALYDAWHDIVNLSRLDHDFDTDFDVVGPICESSDIFGNRVKLPADTAPGDAMVIADAGAYGFSMANTYNLRALPAEDLLDEGAPE